MYPKFTPATVGGEPEDNLINGCPRERAVGFGIAYPDPALDVSCGYCGADKGARCVSPRKLVKDGFHATRQDRARNRHRHHAYRLFTELEHKALVKDPNGPLWTFQSIPHHCGTLGAHVMTECTQVGVA